MGRATEFLEQQTEPVSRTYVCTGIGKNGICKIGIIPSLVGLQLDRSSSDNSYRVSRGGCI